MAGFQPAEAFYRGAASLALLPFRFERTGPNRYLISNMVGDFVRLSGDELSRLIDLELRPADELHFSNSRHRFTFLLSRSGASTRAPIARCPARAQTAPATI